MVNSRCNLNCANCCEFMPYYKEKRERSFEEVKKDIDIIFSKVDYVGMLNLVGAETFLHKSLNQILEYLCSNYGDRVGCHCVITNGTVMPSDETFKTLARYDVIVSISDYALTPAYESKVDEFCKRLDAYQIEYMRNQNIEWYDMGFPRDTFYYGEDTVRRHMKNCNTSCQVLWDEKIWYCSVAVWAYHAGIFPEGENDYLDLKTIDETDLQSKKKILDYCNGDVENGYLQLCKYCGGRGVDNANVVPTAKQYAGDVS